MNAWNESIGPNINEILELIEGKKGRVKIGGKYKSDFNYLGFNNHTEALKEI